MNVNPCAMHFWAISPLAVWMAGTTPAATAASQIRTNAASNSVATSGSLGYFPPTVPDPGMQCRGSQHWP